MQAAVYQNAGSKVALSNTFSTTHCKVAAAVMTSSFRVRATRRSKLSGVSLLRMLDRGMRAQGATVGEGHHKEKEGKRGRGRRVRVCACSVLPADKASGNGSFSLFCSPQPGSPSGGRGEQAADAKLCSWQRRRE